MVITGRQRYENGWCFWSEINKKAAIRKWVVLLVRDKQEGRIERDEDKLW
ncbi:hypothetical protein LINPERPRIM_LOCUS1172 [Linum perenne]